MDFKIINTRILAQKELLSPNQLADLIPSNNQIAQHIFKTRKVIHDILFGIDKRLFVVIGPCSIHDANAAKEYASLLKESIAKYQDYLFIAMRLYFEKPRTIVGWKGLINDPDLDESFKINKGFKTARDLLKYVCQLKIATATEYLDSITPQYVSDLISWSAIGARTTESQIHRQLASGLSCPVGFKNSTQGDIQIAIDAIACASHPHTFLSTTDEGKGAIFSSSGNPDCHLILRGGKMLTNYDSQSVNQAIDFLKQSSLNPRLMIDCSHANSQKQYKKQIEVASDIAGQIQSGSADIFGVMIESNLVEGDQKISSNMTYGQSITDPCLGIEDSFSVLDKLANANAKRMQT